MSTIASSSTRLTPSAVVLGVVRKTWGIPAEIGRWGFVSCALFWLASAAILLVTTSASSPPALPVVGSVLLLGCCLLTASVDVQFSSGAKVDASDLLLAVALASIGGAWVLVFAGVLAIVAPLFRARSWCSFMFLGTKLLWTVAAGSLAAYAWRAGPGIGNPVWNSAAIVAAIFLAFRLCELVSLSFEVVLIDRIWRPRPFWKAFVLNYGTATREVVVMSVSQAPIAALSALAVPVAPASCLLLLLPFLVSLQSAFQAVRLEEAERRAGTDALTGLANRATFFGRVEAEIVSAHRYGHGLALIMGDLDNFKRVNDSRGHLAGDHVLRATAAAFERVIDEAVFPLARYGGEEFVIALPAVSRELVLETAEKVRHYLEGTLEEWGTSISLGVAYLQEGDQMESLIDRADKALYSAKFAGKNRVHEWVETGGLNRPSPVVRPDTARDAA